jgi:AcrR family transcriptional regulator
VRADARRNRERLLSVASTVVAEQGAAASLEEIARRAGVGSATLHRHFPSRLALLDAVFAERVAALCARGESLLAAPDPAEALTTWLREVTRHAAENRGLGTSLLNGTGESSHEKILATATALTEKAKTGGGVKPEVVPGDLLKLANAIALAAEETPEEADHLLRLALTGIH